MSAFETPVLGVLRWAAALAVVAAVHGGALAWAVHKPVDDWDSQTGGAFIVELAAITASPDEETRDLAVGKASAEVAPVAPSMPQAAATPTPPVPEDQPQLPEVQTPQEDALAKRPEEKPPEEKPEQQEMAQAKDAAPVAPVNASEAAAPQKIENATEKSEVPRGQNVGTTRVDRVAIENWQRDLMVHINRHKRYPGAARERQQHGVVMVMFTIDREGRVLKSSVSQGAGSESLDQAAIEMLQRASPLPKPPTMVAGETIDFVVPVRFRWKN